MDHGRNAGFGLDFDLGETADALLRDQVRRFILHPGARTAVPQRALFALARPHSPTPARSTAGGVGECRRTQRRRRRGCGRGRAVALAPLALAERGGAEHRGGFVAVAPGDGA